MAGLRLYRISLLIGIISVQILSQKILSSKKRCGDPQCESLMMRASAKQDYAGPDCRFLSFKAGEEINVYYKLAEGREDLWQGSKGKAYGFFPRDVVNVEEVYLAEEVEVPAQEIDFVCLDGGEYFFENEDSVLHQYRQSEEDFWNHPGTEHGEKTPLQGDISAEDSQEYIHVREPEEEVPDKTHWATSGIAGWFGMGRSPDKQDNTAKTERLDEELLLAEEMPENNVAQPKESEILQPDKPGWFGGRLQRFLPFGGKNMKGEAEASSSTSQFASEEVVVEPEKENTSSDRREAEQENRESKNVEQAKPKWFNFAIKDVLGFGGKNNKKEEPFQIVDETGSPTESSSPESNTEHKTDILVVDQPTMEDANHAEDSNLEPTTVFSELDRSQSDESKVSDTEVNIDVPELIRTPEKENPVTRIQNPEIPLSVNTDHGSTRWLKSVVSNVMNLGKSGGDQEMIEQANIRETNHEVGLSDRNNHALNSISGESEPSREPDAAPKSEEAPGGCGSGEQSAGGYCRAQQGDGRPPRSVPSTEEHCDVILKKTSSAYLVLPSAEASVFLKRAWLQSRALYDDIIGPVRFALSSAVRKVVSLLPEDLQPGPDFHGCSWESLIITALVGCLSILAFTCRTLRCIKSRCYAGRELKLGEQVTEILNSKSEVLEKLSEVQKEYDEVARSLQGSGHQRLLEEVAEHKVLQETLRTSNRELEENITKLEQDLEEEKRRGSELDNTLSALNEKIKALEDSFKNEKSLKEEIRTTQKVFEINKERLESSVRDAVEEQAHLQESVKQLSKEAEGWEERFNELSENSRMLNSSVQSMQEDLSSKQSQVKTLIDSLLKLKDWSSEVEETSNDEDEDGVLANIKWDFENGEPLGAPQKQTIKKLIFAAMLNASLKSTESEKKQLYENLSDEMKAKEHFSERISNLQNTNQSLSAEKKQLEEEVELLKQKMSVMMEVYQENEQKLHRKLTVQEKERLQKEAKLTKADEKVTMTTSELANVRTRLTELEEETERTVTSYQTQVTSYEKKSHDNWLAARAAERYLSDVKRETLTLRQKLTEAEYKVELLEKDPFALDVIHAIGRESSPYGLSPINRIADNRAFLSPPPLLEGPLRLSPMLPAGERGMRPPGYYPGYPGPKERSDVNADRKSDHQRTLSDAGSLSPPWDREQKNNNVPPPGLPYPDHHFAPRRPDRYYHYPPPSGRFSGPAELTRNQGRPLMDSLDGRSSSPDYKSRSNPSRDGPEEANNVPGAPTMEGESVDGGAPEYPTHPPPSMRVPLLPLDPRAPFFRRPFPMPPPPMDMYGPPGYPALPPPHMTMRSPLPPPRYPSYPMHPEAFYPPQHLQPPPRDDHPSQTQHVPPPSADSSHNLSETQT